MYHFCKKDWRRPVSRLWKINEEEYANYVKAEKEGKSFANWSRWTLIIVSNNTALWNFSSVLWGHVS